MNTTSTAAGDFIRVSAAKKKYFGGAMSLRWWYKQIETGRLPHFRAGTTVLLCPADVEAFVAEAFRDRGESSDDPEAPAVPPPTSTRSRSTSGRGGLRFFK